MQNDSKTRKKRGVLLPAIFTAIMAFVFTMGLMLAVRGSTGISAIDKQVDKANSTTTTVVTPPPAPEPEVTYSAPPSLQKDIESGKIEPGAAPVPHDSKTDSRGVLLNPQSSKESRITPSVQVPKPSGVRSRIIIPALGVNARMLEMGNDDGTMILPKRVSDAAHLTTSAPVNSDHGTVVVAGHVNDYRQGNGALWDLGSTKVGSQVWIVDAKGVVTKWMTVSVNYYHKGSLPAVVRKGYNPKQTAKEAPRMAAIVTCGGPIIKIGGENHYRDNTVVMAVPAK